MLYAMVASRFGANCSQKVNFFVFFIRQKVYYNVCEPQTNQSFNESNGEGQFNFFLRFGCSHRKHNLPIGFSAQEA